MFVCHGNWVEGPQVSCLVRLCDRTRRQTPGIWLSNSLTSQGDDDSADENYGPKRKWVKTSHAGACLVLKSFVTSSLKHRMRNLTLNMDEHGSIGITGPTGPTCFLQPLLLVAWPRLLCSQLCQRRISEQLLFNSDASVTSKIIATYLPASSVPMYIILSDPV